MWTDLRSEMGLRKIKQAQAINLESISHRRNETFMKVAGRLLQEYEKNPNASLLLEAQKLLEFVTDDLRIRNTKNN